MANGAALLAPQLSVRAQQRIVIDRFSSRLMPKFYSFLVRQVSPNTITPFLSAGSLQTPIHFKTTTHRPCCTSSQCSRIVSSYRWRSDYSSHQLRLGSLPRNYARAGPGHVVASPACLANA